MRRAFIAVTALEQGRRLSACLSRNIMVNRSLTDLRDKMAQAIPDG
jgi:hypothetical protein